MKHAFIAAAIGGLLVTAACGSDGGEVAQDRPPNAQERAYIDSQLTKLGFLSWERVELDDEQNVWEVENARMADGREYDLELAPGTLEVLEQQED